MMALFVEVDSVEKNCKVIINLDEVVEIAPLLAGGCDLFFSDSAAVGGKRAMKVNDGYELFKQFAMTTVSSEDIAKRFPTKKGNKLSDLNVEIPKL
jgi:hypothetical protein